MNLSGDKNKMLLLQHAGTSTGLGATVRINIWFDAEASAPLMEFLSRQCDAQGIQGIECIVSNNFGSDDEKHYKAQLVISNHVNVANAADTWISAVNEIIHEMPGALVERMLGKNVDDGLAHHSEDTFAWQGSD